MKYEKKPFATSIQEAHKNFITSMRHIGGHTESIPHPLPSPQGTRIFTDIGWLGPRSASKVFLLVSGTHGHEGWAGSAIQIDSLQRGAFNNLPTDTAVAMIHLINPWGCAWGRRENEDNCDLFRDLIYYKPELYCDDHLFDEEVYHALTVKRWDEHGIKQSAKACEALIEKHGELGLNNIMRRGQFRYPDAPCYNGGGISWSFRLYKDFVTRYLNQAASVFCIDIHTAFGEYGDGIIIPYYSPDGPDKAKFEMLKTLYGEDSIYVGGFDPSIPSHPRMPYEIATDFLPKLEITATGLEFGTYEWEDGLNLIKYMNYLFQFGDINNPEEPQRVEQYNQLCYPDQGDWREQVISRSRQVMDQTLKAFD